MKAAETDAAARLLERLLTDPAFRATFRRDPAAACQAAGLDDLAEEMALGGGRALHTLELRESRSSLAGVLMAAAMEGAGVYELGRHVVPDLARLPAAVGDVLSRVDLPSLPGAGALAGAPASSASAAAVAPVAPQAPAGGGVSAPAPAPAPPDPAAATAGGDLPEGPATAGGAAEPAFPDAASAPEPEGLDPKALAVKPGEELGEVSATAPDAPELPSAPDADAAGASAARSGPIDPAEFGAEGKGGKPSAAGLALLENKDVKLDAVGVADIKAGKIDPRVIGVLAKLSEDHEITVSCMCSDHSKFTSGGSISNHHLGRGLDIAAIDGQPVNSGNFDAREIANGLSEMDPKLRPDEIGTPWAIAGPGYFTDAGHQDHLHVGFKQEIDPGWKPPAGSGGDRPSAGDASDAPADAGVAVPGAGITEIPDGAASPAGSSAKGGSMALPAVGAARRGAKGTMTFAAVDRKGSAGSGPVAEAAVPAGPASALAPPAAVPDAVADPAAPSASAASRLGGAALKVAQGELGVREAGNNTGVDVDKYLAAAGVSPGNPWCAGFVTWALGQSGRKMEGGGWAAVQTWVRNAEQGNHDLQIVSADEARPGDLVAYDWGGQDDFGADGHIGFLASDIKGGRFTAVEGNYKDAVLRVPRQVGSDGTNMKFIRIGGGEAPPAGPGDVAAPAAPADAAATAAEPSGDAGARAPVPIPTGPDPKPGSLVFKALQAQEASSPGSTVKFMRAIDPAETRAARKGAAGSGPVAEATRRGGGGGGGGAGADLGDVPADYPGDDASQAELARWLGKQAEKRGLPPELPVMAALVESGVKNLNHGHADSVGFFQMRTSVWNKGPYAGYADKPHLQAKWFLDTATQVKNQRVAAGKPIDDPQHFGEWIADTERPAAQYRGRYQLQLAKARELLGGR